MKTKVKISTVLLLGSLWLAPQLLMEHRVVSETSGITE